MMDVHTLPPYQRTLVLMLIDMKQVLTVDDVLKLNALVTKNFFQELAKKAKKLLLW